MLSLSLYIYIYIYACNIHTLRVAVVSGAVVNRSDFEQQFDGHYAVQKHIIHVTCSWHAADAMLTHVILTPNAGDVAAPPSVPHLAADLILRASARHPNVRLLDAFIACITRSSSPFFTPCWEP